MKIILNQDVVNLGEEGDVVVVKDGYARNYLLPTGAAVLYNKTNAAIFASRAAHCGDQIPRRCGGGRGGNGRCDGNGKSDDGRCEQLCDPQSRAPDGKNAQTQRIG